LPCPPVWASLVHAEQLNETSDGTGRTDADGNRSIQASRFAGEYFVTVEKSRAASSAKKKKHKHRGTRGRSKRKRL
jgi:hypothetical protein